MSESEPLSVTIPADLSAALQAAVASGEYSTPGDALRDAATKWTARHADQQEEVAWIRARIRAPLADPRSSLSAAQVKAHLSSLAAGLARAPRDDEAA